MVNSRKNSVRMLVRRYVMEILHKNPGTQIRLPSNDALSLRFNMARCTVQLEMKLLIEEGFLITKPGIGTFTNPARGSLVQDGTPIIGLFDGDGKSVYYDYYSWELKARTGTELSKLPAVVEDCKLYSEKPKDILSELLSMECSVFVWLSPAKKLYPIISALAKKRSVIIGRGMVPGISSVEHDDELFGYHLGKELLRFGRTKLFYLDTLQSSSIHEGIARAFAAAGICFPAEHYFNSEDAKNQIEAKLKQGFKPDSLIFRHEDGDFIIEKLHELGIDLQEECRIVSIMYKAKKLKEPTLYCPLDFNALAIGIANLAAEHLVEAERPAVQIKVTSNLEMKLI